MPLPKRPSGGTASQNAAPPELGEPKNKAAAAPEQDFALPNFDDLTLPELPAEPELSVAKNPPIPKTASNKIEAPDSSRNQLNGSSSNNQDEQEPSKAAVSDEPDPFEDEDEETALNRELGLLDDDYVPVRPVKPKPVPEPLVESPSVETDLEETDENKDLLAVLEESLEAENDDSDDEFENLLKGLEDITGESSDDTPEVIDDTPTDSVDEDWEAALSELESFNADSSSENVGGEEEDTEDPDDEEDDEEDESWQLEEYPPPSNPFEIPKDFENVADPEDEDDSEEDGLPLPEDDFEPPTDPFVNPFADEESTPDDEEIPELEEEDSEPSAGTSFKDKLKDKVAVLLSPERAKQGLADYASRLKAEMNGEDAPTPKAKSKTKKAPIEDQEAERQEEDDFNGQDDSDRSGGQSGGRGRSPLAIFGFLSPIRSLYMALVNILFGIITAILGILSKLPLIGFVFKIALEATKVLRMVAQYLPLAFLIGALVVVSYLSVPRENIIALPDSGGATFNEFKYDAEGNSVSGVIVNTGDIIADVQPAFTIKSIQPTLNPMTWFMPEVASTCAATPVQVDIDATINVTAECGEPITGFIPRATGELK